MVGTSYCTWSPDAACFPSNHGWPACCKEGAEKCPDERPACEAAIAAPEIAEEAAEAAKEIEEIVGGTPGIVIPETAEVVEEPMVGTSYCTWSPDAACFPSSNGWPACCREGAESCPDERPACEAAAEPAAPETAEEVAEEAEEIVGAMPGIVIPETADEKVDASADAARVPDANATAADEAVVADPDPDPDPDADADLDADPDTLSAGRRAAPPPLAAAAALAVALGLVR